MIYGIVSPVERSQLMRVVMIQSKFIFYPTGSRYFGTATESSDYDYFVQQSQEVEEWLRSIGFTLDSESYSQDPLMVRVYAFEDIHVQVVTNAVAKSRIQWDMIPLIRKFQPDKETAKLLWSICTKLYRDGLDGARRMDLKM